MSPIVICGPSQAGKSTAIHRLLTGHFQEQYPTLEVHESPLTLNTSKGKVRMELHDMPSLTVDMQPLMPRELPWPQKIDGAIVFVSLTSPSFQKEARKWALEVRKRYSNVPLVIVGSKCDLPDLDDSLLSNIKVHRDLGAVYYSLSAKSLYNIVEPFLYIIRQKLGEEVVLED